MDTLPEVKVEDMEEEPAVSKQMFLVLVLLDHRNLRFILVDQEAVVLLL